MENLLSRIIERKKGNINSFIKESSINRSTFFKIKRGARVPTEEQFVAIVKMLSPDPEETRALIEEFEFQRYWKSKNKPSFDIVRQFLLYLSGFEEASEEREQGEKAPEREGHLQEEILDFFRKETEKNSGEIRILISPEMLDVYDWEKLIPIFQENRGEWNCSMLISRSCEEQYDPVRKLNQVKRYFHFVKETGIEANVYRDVTITDLTVAGPYPYWVICRDRMLLIERNLKECIEIRKKSVIANYQEIHDNRVAGSYQILKKYSHFDEIITDMIEKCDQVAAEQKAMYVMSGIPCSVLYVQEEQIRRYCPEKLANLLIEYQRHFHPAVTCEYTTFTGYEKMKKNRNIPEWSCSLQYPESELTVFEENFRKRVKEHRLYFLGEDSGYAPGDYSIALFEDLEINVQSLWNPYLFIQIREQELVGALQKWFCCRDKVAEIEKALGLAEEVFSEEIGTAV